MVHRITRSFEVSTSCGLFHGRYRAIGMGVWRSKPPSLAAYSMSIRTERVGRVLQREIADILQTEFSEQVPSMCTVTGVRMTKDLGIAYVDVSVYAGNLEQRQDALRHLHELGGAVRWSLASRIRHRVRAVPELRFFLDESIHDSKHMDELFDRIHAERSRRTTDAE